MKLESVINWGGWLTVVLAVAACIGILSLLGFGYRATREWERSSELLVTREMEDTADLLATAVMRDMGGVQAHVLANRDWAESSISLSDTSAQIAIAFARYPYPESFFSWRAADPHVVFFNRADRYPAWMLPRQGGAYPVLMETDPPEASWLRRRIDSYGAGQFRYVAFNTQFAGQPYQVVARLMYADSLQAQLHSVIGFTVNLPWVQESYFADIFSQMTPIANRRIGLDIGILDERGRMIWGKENGTADTIREFPLLFLDPTVGKVALDSDSPFHTWKIRASPARDSSLTMATQGADQTLWIAAAGALVLCVGLILSMRAVHAGVALATMRSDFVSSVTHDLKMPLANIRAMADTLALRPVSGDKIQSYGEHLRQEAKHLNRLIDNLLAYARVTDVANVYSFEPIVPARLVSDVLHSFQQPLSEREFTVEVDVPDELPLVRADRAAVVLVLENLVDNAIRYSTDNRTIRITSTYDEHTVSLEVRDRGAGIPPEELAAVRRKFVRGRHTKPGGSGLGLAIVSRVMADHGGAFALESHYGVGTVARISIPVAKD